MSEHRLLTYPDLRARKGLSFSRQYVNELVKQGIFPRPLKTPGVGHVNHWLESEVDAFIGQMVEARDTAPPDAKRVEKIMAARAAKRDTATTTVTPRGKRRA
jgi:predicted DNA-binding transcriptional regulator AlpA